MVKIFWKNLREHQKAVLATAFGLFLYQVGHLVPLPHLLGSEYIIKYSLISEIQNSFFKLGVLPLVTGFFFVEIYARFIYPLQARMYFGPKALLIDSLSSRSRINRSALITSLIVAAFSAYETTKYMRMAKLFSVYALVDGKSLIATGLVVLFFTLGVLAIYFIGQFITKYGLMNGFGFILLVEMMASLLRRARFVLSQVQADDVKFNYAYLVILTLVLASLYKYLSKEETLNIKSEGKDTNFNLPMIPQGIFAVGFSQTIVSSMGTFSIFSIDKTWLYVLVVLIVFMMASPICYYLFYSPKIIQKDLNGVFQFGSDFMKKSKSNLITATGVLILSYVFISSSYFFPADAKVYSPYFLGMTQFIILYVLIKDLLLNYVFLKRVQKPKAIVTFENIHLVEAVRGLLKKESIRFYVKGYGYRRLYSIFNPLYKMTLVVDESDEAKALAIIKLDRFTYI